MQAILKKDVPKLGQKGQLVSVKPGYFRNYLHPKELAVVATENLIDKAQEINAKIAAEQTERAKQAEKVKEELEQGAIVIEGKLNKKGKLYSQISEKDIAEAIKKQENKEINPEDITIKDTIKDKGEHTVNIKLAPSVTASVMIQVTAEDE